MLPLLLAGFGTGLSLIVAIGSQNAFLLQQGLRGGAVAPLVVICAVSDLVLIGLGVSGIGAVLEQWPTAIDACRKARAMTTEQRLLEKIDHRLELLAAHQ